MDASAGLASWLLLCAEGGCDVEAADECAAARTKAAVAERRRTALRIRKLRWRSVAMLLPMPERVSAEGDVAR
jgi:hypothetical protein